MTTKKPATKTAAKSVLSTAVTAQSFLDLAVDKAHFEIIEVPQLGHVGLLKMTLGQRETMVKKWSEVNKDPANQISFAAFVLQATVVNEAGELLLANVPINKINALPFEIADPLFDKAAELNGLKEKKKEEAEKN